MAIRAAVFSRASLVKERSGDEVLYEILHPVGLPANKELYQKAQEASRAYWKSNYKEKAKGLRWNKEIRRECLGAALFALQPKPPMDELVERLDQYWDAFRLQDLQGGARVCLQALSGARIPMGLLAQSLRSSNEIRFELERLGLGRYFFRVLSSEDVDFDLPDPRLLNLMAEKMSCIATEIAYIGPTYEGDVEGAQKAGMVPIVVTRKEPPPSAEGLQAVRSLIEVPALITHLASASAAPSSP